MTEPAWLTRADIEAMHADQIREHGGQLGLRDLGLLASALAPPGHRWAYESDVGLQSLAAEYGVGLGKNHAFLDGNERIAFVAMNVLLILNGLEIETSEPDVVATMLAVAEGRMDRDGLARWLRAVSTPYGEG